jgi:hypothetical protein
MPGTNTAAIPFTVFKVIGSSDALPLTQRLPQKASLTIKRGTPVVLSSGFLIERTAIDGVTKVVAGITDQFGDNLSSDGTASIGGSGLTFGSVPNQSSAVNIPIGAPPNDGLMGCVLASDNVIFQGVVDAAKTTANADIGSIFGLTKDTTTGNWFVDTTITTSAGGACVIVTEFVDPVGVGAFGVGTTGGRVAFKFTKAYQQILQ